MTGFLYYFPEKKGILAKDIDEAGLDGIVSMDNLGCCGVNTGPDGIGGVVIARSGVGASIGYYPEKQTWAQSLCGKYWVGAENANRPGPKDLEREDSIGGHPVILGDGGEWLVPIARAFPEGTRLPQSLIFGPEGKVLARVGEKYARLWADAERVWRDFWNDSVPRGEEPKEKHVYLNYSEQMEIALQALGLNYRLGKDEANLLGILGTDNLISILGALIDMPAISAVLLEMEAAAKKKADGERSAIPGGSTSSDGGRG